MKKLLAILLATIMTVMLAVSCGGGGNNSTTDDSQNSAGGSESAGSIEVDDKNMSATLTIGIPGTNDNERAMIDCLIEGFNKEYPNVKLSYKTLMINTYGNNIQRLATAKNLPDIIWTNSPDIYEVYGYMESLDKYIAASDKAGHFGEDGYKNSFYTEYFDMGKVNNEIYAVPRSCDCVVTFYRKDWFEAAGVDMTKVKNGWTWDDMLEACEKLRAWLDKPEIGMSGVYCLEPNLTSWLSTNVPMLSSLGNEVIDENGKNVVDGEGTKATLELLRDMVSKRYIPDSQVTVGSGFEQGSCAMYFQSMAISQLANKAVFKDKNNLDLVSFPLVGKSVNGEKNYTDAKIGAGIAGYCISKTSANKKLAWAFLRYLLSREGQQTMALHGLNLASIRKDLSDPKVANWGKGYENLNLEAYTWGSEYKMCPEFFKYAPIAAKKSIDTAVRELFNDGTNMKLTIDKAISNCKKAIDDAFAEAE